LHDPRGVCLKGRSLGFSLVQLPQTTPYVAPDVSGSSVITIAEVRAKLGGAAFRVWESLLYRRDRDGITHATRIGLANAENFVPISAETIKSAFIRLRKAGLVRDLGWREIEVPGAHGAAVRRVFMRKVYGARIVAALDGTLRAVMPHHVARWIDRAPSHGGRRAGAGRKKKPGRKVGHFRVVDGAQNQEESGFGNQVHPKSAKSSSPEVEPLGENQVPPAIRYEDRELASLQRRVASSLSASRRSQNQPPAFAGDFFSSESQPMLRREHPQLGVILGQPVLDAPPVQMRGKLVPPYPDIVRVPVARIPSPPLLDAGLGPQRRRSLLARWYRCAVESRFGKVREASAGFARNPKTFALLDRAAALLLEHEVAPAAWCAWCCDLQVQRANDPSKLKAPSIRWVFSEKWITSIFPARRGWFRSESRYLGGRIIAGSALRMLEDRWDAMNQELRRARAYTDDEQRPIIERWLSKKLYDGLIALAHRQAAETQELVNNLARSGDKWLW
jgi:hypothetical protein